MNKYIDFTDICFTIVGKNEFKPTPIAVLAKNLMAKELDLKIISDIKPITQNVKSVLLDVSGVLRHEIQCIKYKIEEIEEIVKKKNADKFLDLNKMPRFQDEEEISDDDLFKQVFDVKSKIINIAK